MNNGANRNAAVLMYHRISDAIPSKPEERIYAIAPSVFREHLQMLADRGRELTSLAALAKGEYEDEAFVLTFDDGFDSDLHQALPILKSFGASAAFFISPALVGTDGYMSWSEIETLVAAGMEVGTHGLDHTPLDVVSQREAEDHLYEAKRLMERQLGMRIDFTSLPGGGGGKRVVRAAYDIGYRLVLGSKPLLCREGRSRSTEVPRFALRRGPASSIDGFRGLVELDSGLLRRYRLRYRLVTLARTILGRPAYELVTRRALARVIRRSNGWPRNNDVPLNG